MRAGREIIQLKIIRKLDRSKIIEYSIEQYNTHIITSQLQRRPSEFIKALTTRFSPQKFDWLLGRGLNHLDPKFSYLDPMLQGNMKLAAQFNNRALDKH